MGRNGSPSLSKLSVHNGDLLERRHGLRKDDQVEILLDARAFKENDTGIVSKGRFFRKNQYRNMNDEGTIVYVARRYCEITLIAHIAQLTRR